MLNDWDTLGDRSGGGSAGFVISPRSDDAQFLDGLASLKSGRDGAVSAVDVVGAVLVVEVPVGTHQVVNLLLLDGRFDGSSLRCRRSASYQPLDNLFPLATSGCSGAGTGWSRTCLRLIGIDQPSLDVIPRRWVRVL